MGVHGAIDKRQSCDKSHSNNKVTTGQNENKCAVYIRLRTSVVDLCVVLHHQTTRPLAHRSA